MNIKKYVAEGIRKIAVKKAYRSVGKSLPLGMHEVEVPKCLKNDTLEKKMKQICQKIAFWCQQNSDMPEEEYPILVYGVEVLANTSVKILGLLILGYICNCIVEAVITIAVFGSMRYWSGGYHCKTHIGCFSAMLGMCIGSTVLSKIMIQKSALIWLLMVTYSCWAVIRYAPQVSHINPITSSNILRKKRIGSLIWVMLEAIIIILCKNDSLKLLIAMPLFCEALTLLPILQH